ncbi:MAG: hypothetical protein HPY79_06890 [Bacteroidales bacterium]|nr:hypothetical protein [Bacteroidales bacterium]
MMKLIHLKHNEIDKVQWEKSILHAVNGNLYAFAWYLDIVSPNWEALVSDHYEIVIPLPIKKIFGTKIIIQPLFAQQLGFFSINVKYLSNIEDYVKQVATLYPYCNINTNKLNLIESIHDNNIVIHHKINYELDLIATYSYIYNKYHTNTKRNLVKAQQHNLRLKINTISAQTFVHFIRKNVGIKVPQLKKHDYNKMLQIISNAIKYKFGEIYEVYDENNELIAATFFIFSHQKAYYLFAASSPTGKEKRAMFYLIDQFIKRYAEKNVILDFEGSMIPGLARYYESFGAVAGKYQQIILNRLPFYLRWLKP